MRFVFSVRCGFVGWGPARVPIRLSCVRLRFVPVPVGLLLIVCSVGGSLPCLRFMCSFMLVVCVLCIAWLGVCAFWV